MPLLTRPRLYWLLQLSGWTLFMLLGILLITMGGQRLTGPMLAAQAFMLVFYLGITHAMRAWFRRRGWLRLSVGRVALRLLPLNLGVAFATQCLVSLLMIYGLHVFTRAQFRWTYLLMYTLNMNFVFWLWTGAYFGLHYFDSHRQAEVDKWKLSAAVREAEMRTLKAQINPHFMFNGLNNIRALVTEDPARARDMITHLSDLLRYSIQLSSAEQVPLARELEIVTHYLALEAVQLEERLTYTLDVAPAALPVLIPPMTLQLLVENSIKHGIAPRPEGGHIHLTARLSPAADALQIQVTNTGRYAPTPGYEGVGLRNARERLHLLFGPRAHLSIGNSPTLPDTVLAELQLPLRNYEL